MRQRKPHPEVNELVVATVREIFDYGAYVTLDEYNDLRAFLPWSEITSKWIKDVREVLREGMKVVGKVIRINKAKMQIDISTKRVYDDEKRKKLLEYKRKRKADTILEIVSQRLGKKLEDAYKEVGWKLEDAYGDIYYAFEAAFLEGEEVLRKCNVPEEWITPLMEEIGKRFERKKVGVSGVLVLRSMHGEGIKRIKSVLESAMQSPSDQVEVKIYTIGAPKYKVEVVAGDYKTAEKALAQIVKNAESVARKLNVEFEFKR